MIETARDQNFRYQFDMQEGWFATIPVNNWDSIPDEEFRVHVGSELAWGRKLTWELLQKLYESYIVGSI